MSTFLCFLIKFPVQTFNKLGMINSAPCSPTAKLTNMAILLNRSPARVNKQHPTNIFGYFFKYIKNKILQENKSARKLPILNSHQNCFVFPFKCFPAVSPLKSLLQLNNQELWQNFKSIQSFPV